MRILKAPVISGEEQCPYLDDRRYRQEYFAAAELDVHQFRRLLQERWRRFGLVFFRPVCPHCRECVPIRVKCRQFQPSRSQKRVIRRNEQTTVRFSELQYREELFDIYEKHSRLRFDQYADRDEFSRNFFTPAVPSFQSEYYVEGKLAGFGILDMAADGLSSVYFCFDPDFSDLSLGTYSAIMEIRQTAAMGLEYYYLGYYIRDCSRMSYKARFQPYELMRDDLWSPAESEESVGIP